MAAKPTKFAYGIDVEGNIITNGLVDGVDVSALATTVGSKQDSLGFTPENSTNKRTSFQATPDDAHYPSEKLVSDSLAAKVPATRTVNSHPLSADVVVTKGDVGLSNVDNVQQLPLSYLDTDGTLSANSDTKVASQKAVKTYADGLIAAANAMVFRGVIDASANPNYPAANAGDAYRISVAGKIGGASGLNVEVGDLILCLADATSAGTHASVGSNWNITQVNIDGAVVGPVSSTDSAIALFNGTSGKSIKNSSITISTDGTLSSNSDSKVLTEKAAKTYVDTQLAGVNPSELALANGNITSFSATANSTLTVIDSFAKGLYRSVKWDISTRDVVNNRYENTTVMAVHDGTTVDYTEFGKISIPSSPGVVFSVVVNGANIELKVQASSNNNEIKGIRTTIEV